MPKKRRTKGIPHRHDLYEAAVQSVEAKKTKATVNYKLRKDDSEHALEAETVLVATGRRPFSQGLGLEALGVKMTERGQVMTEDASGLV